MVSKLLFILKSVLIALAVLFLLWTVFALWLINPLSQRLAPWVGHHKLDSQLSVQSVHLTPFSLKLDIVGLKLTRMDGQVLAGVDHVHAEPSLASIRKLSWQVNVLQLEHPYAFVQREQDGQLNWSALIRAMNAKPSKPKTGGMPSLLVQHLQIRQGDFRYTEAGTHGQPWQASLNPFNLDIDNLSTIKDQAGTYNIHADLPHQGCRLNWSGQMTLNPLASTGQIVLEGLQVNRLTGIVALPAGVQISQGVITSQVPYHFDLQNQSLHLTVAAARIDLMQPDLFLPVSALQSPLRLSGRELQLHLALSLVKNATTSYRLDVPDIHLEQLQASSGTARLASLGSLDIRQVQVDPDRHAVHVATISLDNLQSQIRRNRQGKLNIPLAADKHNPTAPVGRPTASASMTANSHSSPWTATLDHFNLSGLQLALQDQSTGKPIKLDLVHGQLTADHVDWPLRSALPIHLALDNASGGSLQLKGHYQPTDHSGEFTTHLHNWSLMPVAPLVNQFARLTLKQGSLSSDGKLTFRAGHPATQLDYAGEASIDHLSIHEQDTGKNFLGWSSLAAHGLHFSLKPEQLDITELVATKPYAKIIVYADKTLNLKRIQRAHPAPASASSSLHRTVVLANAQPTGLAKAGTGNTMRIRIHRIHFINGSADYSDLSLPTPFGTQIHALYGYIVGLSSRSSDSARVELHGKVDQFGSASLTGRLQPFHATDNTHLKLVFTNIEMANLTPYSGKFAGRKIDSGKLSATMDYTIVQHQLNGKNTFIINKLRLGERVDSQDSVNLPLNLAIALLEDNNGVINLDLPVSGDLNDPKFSYGGIIWKAIVNVLTKIVTAPFRALGHLFGLTGDHPEQILFAAGISRVSPPEQEKLDHLVQALNKRATLRLGVQPGWNDELDRAALQKLALRVDVAKQLGLKVAPGQNPGPIDPDDGQTRRALEKLYNAQSRSDYYALMRQSGLSGHALYIEIKHQLQARESITADQLKALGEARGTAIREQMVDHFHLAADRLEILPAAPVSSTEGQVIVGLKLSTK